MRVLISGAGVAGPTLAWFLAKSGARVTVVEKAPALLPHGQNVDIQGSARNVIRKMGLMEEVRRFNTTETGTQFIDPSGRPFAPLPLKDKASSASFTSELEILRADLAAVLYNATKDNPGTEYLFGITVKQVISNDEKSVKVELSNGNVEEFDLLVAADGQWSKLRKQVFPREEITIIDKGMYAVYYTVPRKPDDNNWWNIYLALGSRTITTRPDPHGTTRAMFTYMPRTDHQKRMWEEAERSDRKCQQELLRSVFADAGWQAQRFLDNMDQAPDWYFHPMKQIKMAKWSKNRIICLGDAAFAPTPLTGMGTSLAILGGDVLGGELSLLKDGENPSAALQAYESKFRPFVDEVMNIPWFVPGIAHMEKEWQRIIFRVCIRTISWAVSIPFIANRKFNTSNDEDFNLPSYPMFEAEVIEKI
jgi:2-polyprenyl-6-methoxyphenol hydroxylase-like FAD-dependent oxidoreductase